MKYLKLFEDNKEKEELRELIPEINDLCQDLKDRGFEIKIGYGIFTSFEYLKLRSNKKMCENILDGLYIAIDKFSTHYANRYFYINNIKDDLLFIESYAIAELNLKINYYSVEFINEDGLPVIEHYKNNEDLSLDVKTDLVIIHFAKA